MRLHCLGKPDAALWLRPTARVSADKATGWGRSDQLKPLADGQQPSGGNESSGEEPGFLGCAHR